MRHLSILGSTGSIGQNTLEVVSAHPDKFRVVALAARNSVELLEKQVHKYRPEVVAVFHEDAAQEMQKLGLPVKVLTGMDGLVEAATLAEADMVVSAIVGSDGLLPTYAAITAGKDIALATKEALVMAGQIVMSEAAARGVRILPVDSEHSSVFQCINGRNMDEVEKVILTASGGPFLGKSREELSNVTPSAALRHPTWTMGRKISIDSATLMNKGLEVIEAFWLFDLPLEKIDVILHPQSIIHSMVKFVDGSVIAHMSMPDMKGPISYALSYPERFENVVEALDLAKIGALTFQAPDMDKYASLNLTYCALRTGGTMPCVLNAANEVAVEAFLDEKIPFTEITNIIDRTMADHTVSEARSIEEVIGASEWAKQRAGEFVNGFSGK
ncbi:MAG: 1-deoxy-D-xylulose 5-phosphate reductoisomerase [Nitrospira bacterium SG8_35_4]|nr:MAG: 1-deoxy-D-xylulose 5-phosphate reductoisomerase [Nitrospira bacterium SG8_35_4]